MAKERERIIPDYEVDVLMVVDIAKAMRGSISNETRLRVLRFVVDRELGTNYKIVRE